MEETGRAARDARGKGALPGGIATKGQGLCGGRPNFLPAHGLLGRGAATLRRTSPAIYITRVDSRASSKRLTACAVGRRSSRPSASAGTA